MNIRNIQSLYRISKSSKEGFSLVELITYIALVSLMFASLASFVGLLLQSRNQHIAVSEVEHQGVFILDQLTQTIRQSQQVTSPLVGVQGATLSLDMPSPSPTPVVVSITDGVLYYSENNGPEIRLSNDKVQVTNFTVHNLARVDTPGTVQVRFTLQYVEAGNNKEEYYEQTFYGSASLR